jgi:phenylalanyl-tRNA synthetase beta chain
VIDPDACPLFVTRTVTGFDPTAPTPRWLARRIQLAGMRPISLAVDVTNYVMLELGQPIHGYDRDRLRGAIVVRRAQPGETLRTLDGQDRRLDDEDLLITDDRGPIGLAGVMGGESTEISPATTAVVIEAAAFDPVTTARAARRHKLVSEASRALRARASIPACHRSPLNGSPTCWWTLGWWADRAGHDRRRQRGASVSDRPSRSTCRRG